MKKLFALLFIVVLSTSFLFASSLSLSVESMLLERGTTQYFKDDEIPEEDIEQILKAGRATESGMNSQSWHFSAVTNKALLDRISDEMKSSMRMALPNKAGIADAPLAIVISTKEGSEFDAGLACQSMAIEALNLGYGVKVLGSPTIVLNGENRDEYKEILGIPSDMSAIDVLIVGEVDEDGYLAPDAVSSASERKPYDDVVRRIR